MEYVNHQSLKISRNIIVVLIYCFGINVAFKRKKDHRLSNKIVLSTVRPLKLLKRFVLLKLMQKNCDTRLEPEIEHGTGIKVFTIQQIYT